MSKQQGFTLIEVLIYLGLFSVIFVSLLASAFVILRGINSTETKAMVLEEGNFLLAKFDWAVAGATAVSVVSNPPSLNISRFSNPITLTFSLNGNNLQMNRGAGAVTLNNSNVIVSNLVFSNIGAGTQVESVQVTFILSAKTSSGQDYSQTFIATKYLKK